MYDFYIYALVLICIVTIVLARKYALMFKDQSIIMIGIIWYAVLLEINFINMILKFQIFLLKLILAIKINIDKRIPDKNRYKLDNLNKHDFRFKSKLKDDDEHPKVFGIIRKCIANDNP